MVPVHTLIVVFANVLLYYSMDTRNALALHVPVAAGDEWRLLTLILAHWDEWHLWNNTMALLVLGVVFESVHGPVRIAVVYWTSGLFASLAEVALWSTGPRIFLGASGAVYGLAAAYAAHLAINWTETPFRLLGLLVVFVAVALELVIPLSDPQPNIAYAAHGFGALSGFVVALFAVRNFRVVPFERLITFGAFTVAVAGIATLAIVVGRRIEEWGASEA